MLRSPPGQEGMVVSKYVARSHLSSSAPGQSAAAMTWDVSLWGVGDNEGQAGKDKWTWV